jgi:hypothetical protein
MNLLATIQAAAILIGAVTVLWIASQGMLNMRAVRPLLPLVWLAVSLCGIAAMFYYDLTQTYWEAVFASGLLSAHVLLLVAVVRMARSRP